jgi:hypothetical protein
MAPAPNARLRITNVLGYVLLIVVNVLASMGALGGSTNAEVSGRFTTPLTPAG